MLPNDDGENCSFCKKHLPSDISSKWISQDGVTLNVGGCSLPYVIAVTTLGELSVCEECYTSLPDYLTQEDLAEIHYQFGLEYRDRGNHQRSLDSCKRSIALTRTPKVLSAIGDAHRCLGNRNEAIDAYRKALELDPSESMAKNNLARLMSDETDLTGRGGRP
jgi:tetratricopeptide (TPR) repeat protein